MTDLEHIAEIFRGYEGVPDGYGASSGYRCYSQAGGLSPAPLEGVQLALAGVVEKGRRSRARLLELAENRLRRKAALSARRGSMPRSE